MKKILILLGGAAMMLGAYSCGGGSKAPETLGDSLALYLGQANGYALQQNIAQLPEEMASKINKDQFLAGLKTILNVDTANADYLQGVQMGLQLWGQIAQWEKADIKFNRDLFFAEMSKSFKADSVNEVAYMDAQQALQGMMQKAYKKVMEAQQKEQAAAQAAQEEKYNANKAAGDKFVAEKLASDKEMVKTESGLVYKVNKMGTGAVAKSGDRVKVIYSGKTIDGKEFDSSDGKEVPFSTRGVIPGFAEALTTLPAGTEVTLYIPEDLGYGRQGTGSIEPGSTLIFEMTIGEVEIAAQQNAAPKGE